MTGQDKERVSVCPAGSAELRSMVLRFLTRDAFSADRQKYGMTAIDTGSVRLLIDASDSTICRRLGDSLSFTPDVPRAWSVYQAESFYFIPTVQVVHTGIHLTLNPMIVLDSTLTPLQSYGM